MKRYCLNLLAAIVFSSMITQPLFAADLIEVYKAALAHDSIFQQAIATQLANKQGVPIAISSLLPNVSAEASPSFTRTGLSGSNYVPTIPLSFTYVAPRNSTIRAYAISLVATQTVFNFADIATVLQQRALSKQADAILNAALQDLMVRTTRAYLAILEDEDNLSASKNNESAYAAELHQMQQEYQVGEKTPTDIATADAAFQAARATSIAAKTKLLDDRENLRVMTGQYYTNLNPLSEKFPLSTPALQNMETWVDIAAHHNWAIKAAQYNVTAAREIIKQQFAGHLPTVNVQASLDRTYTNNINNYQTFDTRNGPGTQTDKQVAININLPLFSGGGVLAATAQAHDNYQATQSMLDQTILQTLNQTRQSYLGLLAGKSQLNADQLTIKATISSLNGLKASFTAGSETLVDVLNQQQKVFVAKTRYAADRYLFVNDLLSLKQAAGTLSVADLTILNNWLHR